MAPRPLDPVVLVPGITASELRDEYDLPPSDVWTAVLHRAHKRVSLHPEDLRYEARQPARTMPNQVFQLVYEELIEELRDDLRANEVDAVPVYPFAYDWRLPLQQTEKRLANFITEVIGRTRLLPHYRHHGGPSRVHLVAHSMGGLVVAGYLQKYRAEKVSKVVTLAAPFQGSCDSIVELINGKGRTIFPQRKARKRRAARLTPAAYHLLPTFDGAIEFNDGIPSDIFDPEAWQPLVVDSIARTAEAVGTSGDLKGIARTAFCEMLQQARDHRRRIEGLSLKDIGLEPGNWLAVVGIGKETYLKLGVGMHEDQPRFSLSSPNNQWYRKRNPDSRETGDGIVPLRGAIPRFLDESRIVCVAPFHFLPGERFNPPPLRFASFHAQIPTMDLVHRLIIRFFTGASNPDDDANSRPLQLPGLTGDWNPPVT